MAERIETGTTKRGFFWHITGVTINAAATVVLTIAATRIANVDVGGILGLALGLCQIFSIFATYEVRPYQSTDLGEKYQFSEYFGLRILTCIAMTVICSIYVFGFRYSGDKASVIFAVCIFKMLDSFSDVFLGEFQQKQHLEYSGQGLAMRVFASALGYIIVLWVTHHAVWAAWTMPAVSLLCILIFDFRVIKKFETNVRPSISFSRCRGIMKECFPLFFSGFMNMYILNATKIKVDSIMPQLQGYWNPIYMPAFVINLFSIFAFTPMLTTLQTYWNNRNEHKFLCIVRNMCLWIFIVTLGALVGAWFLGIPVLELLYGLELKEYKLTLILVLIGGGFNALATVLYYIITVMRRQYYLFLGDGITFVVTVCITAFCMLRWGLNGAALAYIISMLVRVASFFVIAIYGYTTRKKFGEN